MQIAKFSILIISLLFSIQTFGQKIESPKELGKVVFEALVKKDSVLFEKTKITEADLKFTIHRMMQKIDKKVDDKEIEKAYSIYSKNIVFSFVETIKEGEKEGINWSEITFLKTEYYERPNSDPEFIEIGKTYLEFQYKNKTYIIKIGDSIKIKGNWSIEDTIRWNGEKEED